MNTGFDSEKYLREQSEAILERAGKFGDKLYLEFGGKLICDYHAARVLPGFDPDAKINTYVQFQLKIPGDLQLEAGDASMLITLKEVLGYAESAGVGLNTPVLIMGLGSVGLAFCKALRMLGAYPVIAAARRETEFQLALALGADFVVNTEKQDLGEAVREITRGGGALRLIDVTGAPGYVVSCMTALAQDGKVCPYAKYPPADPLENHVAPDRILKGRTGEVRTHDFICSAVRHHALDDLHKLYSHRLPFRMLKEGFEMIERKEAFKIVFDLK